MRVEKCIANDSKIDKMVDDRDGMAIELMRIASVKNQNLDEPLINLTPLIDVVFVILIMFIVVAPLLEMDQVELADAGSTPGSTVLAVQESSPIAIHVHKDNTIWYNKQRVTIGNLITQLKQAKQRYPKAQLQLFHDKQAHFGTYQSLKNAAEAAGFERMDVILNNQ